MTKPSELRVFGLSMALMCGVLGAILRWKFGLTTASSGAWTAGGGMLLSAAIAPILLRPVFRAWMILTWPLRWAVSHAALGGVFFLVLTPIGWVMRRRGHDPLRLRKPRAGAEQTLWTEVKSDDRPERAFQQF